MNCFSFCLGRINSLLHIPRCSILCMCICFCYHLDLTLLLQYTYKVQTLQLNEQGSYFLPTFSIPSHTLQPCLCYAPSCLQTFKPLVLCLECHSHFDFLIIPFHCSEFDSSRPLSGVIQTSHR